MLHAARASVHHSGARAPETGKTLLDLRDLAGKAETDPPLAPDAESEMTATPGLVL